MNKKKRDYSKNMKTKNETKKKEHEDGINHLKRN